MQDLIEISFHKLNDNCTYFNCSFRHRLLPTSLFKHALEKASKVSAKHVVLEVGFASEASKKNIYIFLGHHHLKSSVLRWDGVQFSPDSIQAFNNRIKYEKIEGCEQSILGKCRLTLISPCL